MPVRDDQRLRRPGRQDANRVRVVDHHRHHRRGRPADLVQPRRSLTRPLRPLPCRRVRVEASVARVFSPMNYPHSGCHDIDFCDTRDPSDFKPSVGGGILLADSRVPLSFRVFDSELERILEIGIRQVARCFR